MPIAAGQLRHQIVIQSLQTTKNDYGEEIKTWVDGDPIRARVVFGKGREAFEAARVNATETIRIQIRYRDVATTDRVQWKGKLYDVTGVDDSMRHHNEMWLTGVASDV